MDVIKKIKPMEAIGFTAEHESNINTKNKRQKIDLPIKDKRKRDEVNIARASKILEKVNQGAS